jgi:type II secretory pathway pseudopilin PulG
MTSKRRAAGFSLLEVVIAGIILAGVMAAIYSSLYSGTQEYEVNSRRAWILHQARLAVDQLSEDLRQGTRLTMVPAVTVPNAPAETAPTNNISFKMALAPDSTGKPQVTAQYITYMWAPSGAPSVTSPVTGAASPVGGSTWIDANGNGVLDEGMLVKIDPNPADANNHVFPPRILCNYLKNDPNGFKVSQSVVTVNNERMLQIHIVLTLVFTDSKNKVLEQTVESKTFVRNLQ